MIYVESSYSSINPHLRDFDSHSELNRIPTPRASRLNVYTKMPPIDSSASAVIHFTSSLLFL
jgi:hypothetical protein